MPSNEQKKQEIAERQSHQRRTTTTRRYSAFEDIWLELVDLLRPPERITVSEAAEKYIYLNNPGQYIGPYSNAMSPYMEEPQNELQSRFLTGLIFVGSAQTGKTQGLILNWVGYSAVVDGLDMIVFSPTQSGARDFSMRRIDRLHRHSPKIGAIMLPDKDADNVFDKQYRTGMLLNLSWPTVGNLAGRPVGRIAITDYDRIEDDISGEGSSFDLAAKRTTTFGSFAMTVAESSPSRDIEDPRWIPSSPHEAPPCKGILALYNRGDRRRWFWPCPHCDNYFEGKWEHLQWDTKRSFLESAETVRMICPTNSCVILPRERQGMQEAGVWLKEGQSIDPRTHAVVGDGIRSRTASFWLMGVAANFSSWTDLVVSYLNAMNDFEKTKSEDALRKFFNTDLAQPYLPKSAQSELSPLVLKARAEDHETFPVTEMDPDETIDRLPRVEPLVPEGVRFLVATVDVQNNLFVVQVHGIIPGESMFDMAIIDRFQIRKSRRLDGGGKDHEWVRPASYPEDWDEIKTQVMDRTYELSDGSGRRMGIRMTGCDSGGREGVTTNAYQFYREIRAAGRGTWFHLLKGDPLLTRPRAQITMPDANRKDRLAMARGDIPLMLLNSNILKDTLRGRLEVLKRGQGMIRFPKWFHDTFFTELCVETRDDKGWQNPRRLRNEAWDLAYYAIGMCVSPVLKVEGIDWSNPPSWAEEWDKNDLVNDEAAIIARFQPQAMGSMADFAALARQIAS